MVASVVAGITEPIEFLFLFVAPVLYLIHAALTGLGFMTMGLLGVTIGNTDGNIIDFIVFGLLQGWKTKWYLVPIVGAVWFVVYYAIFRFAIVRFDLKTPGREKKGPSGEKEDSPETGKTIDYNARKVLEALGGADNILSLDNCITRLRLVVKDMKPIDEESLKANGAIGVVKLDETNLQVVVGPQVGLLKNRLEKLIEQQQRTSDHEA